LPVIFKWDIITRRAARQSAFTVFRSASKGRKDLTTKLTVQSVHIMHVPRGNSIGCRAIDGKRLYRPSGYGGMGLVYKFQYP